jgi:hypothetical protein
MTMRSIPAALAVGLLSACAQSGPPPAAALGSGQRDAAGYCVPPRTDARDPYGCMAKIEMQDVRRANQSSVLLPARARTKR